MAAAQDDETPDAWKFAAEFSFTDQAGNKALRLLIGGLDVSHLEQDEYRLDAELESRYGRSEGDLVTLSHQASVAFGFRPRADWSPFLSINAERDEFKRLDLRLSTGAGFKYIIRSSEDAGVGTSVSLSILHSYERIAPKAPDEEVARTASAESKHFARWNLRATTSHELRDGITLRHTTSYQPLWDDLASYLLRSETGIKILLIERLAVSVDYQLKRDARPPPGVEPDDRLFKTGLIIDF